MKKVKEGYKISELGEVPKEWLVTSIGEYIEQKSIKNKDLQVVNVVSVTKYRGIVDSLEYFDKQVFSKDISTYKIIEKDEFAYSTIHLNEGALGYLQHCNKAVLSPMYTVFKIDSNVINKYFLYNILKSKKYIDIYERIGEGSVDRRSSIPFNKFKDIKIALPPIKEQEKITSILSTVDEQIDNVDGLIEKNKELKKGLMQKLLTKGIGHTKFKNTEIGEIPEGWEVKKLGEVFRLSSGNFLSQKNIVEGSYPVYGGNGITGYHNEFLFNDAKLVIGRVGAKCGCVCISEPNAWITDNALYISEKIEKFNDKYMYYLLDNINLNSYANQNAQPVISGQKIYSIDIGFPDIKEQENIALILLQIDKKIDEYKNKKQKLEELKIGLIQQLLTGKVRV